MKADSQIESGKPHVRLRWRGGVNVSSHLYDSAGRLRARLDLHNADALTVPAEKYNRGPLGERMR